MDRSICFRHWQMLRGVVICFFDDNHPMSSFREVLRTNPTSTSTADNDDIRFKNFWLRSRWKLDKGKIEPCPGLAMNWGPRKPNDTSESGTLPRPSGGEKRCKGSGDFPQRGKVRLRPALQYLLTHIDRLKMKWGYVASYQEASDPSSETSVSAFLDRLIPVHRPLLQSR